MPALHSTSTSNHLGYPKPHMDVHQLDEAVRRYFTAALATSTRKTYLAAERHYQTFCSSFNIKPLPVTESILCYFAACLGQQGLSHNSISTYLSGIRQLQISHGLGDPHVDQMPCLRQVLKGIKIEAGRKGKAPCSRLPITPAILRKLKAVWMHTEPSFKAVMLWAASAVTFFTFCRSGETTVSSTYDPSIHLSLSDLVADRAADPTLISLNIKQSKTDQGRIGIKVIVGRTGGDICPVSALLRYLLEEVQNQGPCLFVKMGPP